MGISLIDTGLEVIIGESGWTEKLPNLERVIAQVTGRMDSVRAVDMRFGEKIFIKK
jgi:cell division septal protein FtsQ